MSHRSLFLRGARQAQLKSLSEQASSSRRAAELADAQYREGVGQTLGDGTAARLARSP